MSVKGLIVSIIGLFSLFSPHIAFGDTIIEKFSTVESTKAAKINVYIYESEKDVFREKPILLVHGFNSSGSVWSNEKNNYVKRLTQNGYDVIVVDMRGNAVDTNGDHKADTPIVGNSWGYGVRDLGDDVGIALTYAIDYLNKNLPGRNYQKADVITHSTGGLAVTSYSRSLGLVPYRNNIDTLIELAPPNNGSTSLVANIKNVGQIAPSVFAQSLIAYEYCLEFVDNRIWIPGGRMESENLRKELIPESLFLKSIEGLGPDPRIKTYIAIGDEDWVVGDWSPVIDGRDDIGYEYFIGLDHFSFCNSETVILTLLDKLQNGEESDFFKRYKPYRNRYSLAFLSGPGIDHPDDTFDVVNFAKNIEITPRQLFELYLRIAGRKGKTYLLKYWEALNFFENAQKDFDNGVGEEKLIEEWQDLLKEKNNFFNKNFNEASKEYLECPDIAVLANGYYNELIKLILEKVGEPIRLIDHTFSPSILDEQKLLIIPSGGLSGLSHSAIFRKKLSEFAKNGGTIVCFSQQYGYDFTTLPGGILKGYGWQEDVSCHSNATYIENFHQILSSQNQLYPDIKIDGYFTDYPDDAKVLLRRTKNLMPAMLMYDFGEGKVIAMTLYSDWGYTNGQIEIGEINLIRDLIRWTKQARDLPEYKIGEGFQETIDIEKDFGRIEVFLKSPDNTILEDVFLDRPKYEPGIVLNRPGIYCVDYVLYDSESNIIQPQTEGFYFSYSEPPSGTFERPGFTFDITSDSEGYIKDSEAEFTIHINNNTSQDEFVKCKGLLVHHNMQFGESILVPAMSSVSIIKRIKVKLTDRLLLDFYSSGNDFLGHAERGINIFEPLIRTSLISDKSQYAPGQEIKIDSNVTNDSPVDMEISLVLDIVDSNRNEVFYNTKVLRLSSGETYFWKNSFTVPKDVARTAYRIKIAGFYNSRLVGSSSIIVEVPGLASDLEKGISTDAGFMTLKMQSQVYAPGDPILAAIKLNNSGDKTIDSGVLYIKVLEDLEKGVLYGRVMDEQAAPIGGALVNGIYTNKDGMYKIENVKRGAYTLDVSASGYNRISEKIDILGGDVRFDINLVAIRYGNISGNIKNLIGETVTLEPIDVEGVVAETRQTIIGPDGNFRFTHLPVGRYRLDTGGLEETIVINEGENGPIEVPSIGPILPDDVQPEEGDCVEMNEIEPNNDFDNATELEAYSSVKGKIDIAGDEDHFRLEIASPSILNISIKNVEQGFRPYVRIYGSNKRWFDSTAGLSGQEVSYDVEISNPGTYYVNLNDRYNTFVSTRDYLFIVKAMPVQDRYEPDSTFETANKIAFKEVITANIFPRQDEDYFYIDIDKKGILYVEMLGLPSGLRPSLKIYNASKNIIGQKGGAGGEKICLEAEISESGRYYIMLKDWYSNFSSPEHYYLRVYFIDTLDAYEPNNTKEEAVPLDFGKDYFATIATKADSDFYRLSVPDAGKVTIYLKDIPSNIRPYLKLYRATDTTWFDSKALSAGEDLTFEFDVAQPSNYYIQIQDRYNSETSLSRYRLLVRYIPYDTYTISEPAIYKEERNLSNIDGEMGIGLELPGIEKTGRYYLDVIFRPSGSDVNFQAIEGFYIGEPDVLLGRRPMADIVILDAPQDGAIFNAGGSASFRFRIKNNGDAGGLCDISFRCIDLISQDRVEFLEPGKEKDLEFNFSIPIDMEEGEYQAEYTFKGITYPVKFKIIGLRLKVSAEFENGFFIIDVENTGGLKDVELFAEARAGDFEARKDFILKDSCKVSFDIEGRDLEERIYYGIYFSTGKALYLNSFLLDSNEDGDISGDGTLSFKIIKASCDKDIYASGDNVNLEWEMDCLDATDVRLVADLISPDGNSTVVIDEEISLVEGKNILSKEIAPGTSLKGLYRVLYRFIYGEGLILQGSIFFDIGGEVKIDLAIEKSEYLEGDAIECKADCFSSFNIKGEVSLFINGKEVDRLKDITLDGYKVFSFKEKAGPAGDYSAYCSLWYEGEKVDSSSVTFNVLSRQAPNHKPTLFVIPDKDVSAGECLEFFVQAEDRDGDNLLYSVEALPGGATFDINTGRFFWVPGENQLGEYLVVFGVSDGKDSVFENVKIVVDRPIHRPPVVVRPLAEPVKGMAPLEVSFSADSLFPGKDVIKYEWDFDGKGIYDFWSCKNGDIEFVYTGGGVFPATLRLTYDNGDITTHTVDIDVEENPEGPVVILDVSPLEGIAPCKVYFKGIVFSDAEVCRYEWDFDGDGVFDAYSLDSAEIVKTYTSPGRYEAEFRVTNSKGISASKIVSVVIENPIVIDVKPVISDKSGFVPMEVEFDAIVPDDIVIQKYQWDFEGDGVFDFVSIDSPKVTHRYIEPGVYLPTLRITDERNLSGIAKEELNLGVLGRDDLDVAKLTIVPMKGKSPLEVKASFELPDMGGLEYYWDFDGDCVYDIVTTLPEASYLYYNAGSYNIFVEAKRKDGTARSAKGIVYVKEGRLIDTKAIGLDNPGLLRRKKDVYRDRQCKVELSDGTRVVLPAGFLEEDDIVDVRKLEEGDVFKKIILEQENVMSIGEYREYKFERHSFSSAREAIIDIPYQDTNDDGIIDDKGIDELTLDAYWFDEDLGEWRLICDALIYPKENRVSVPTSHFSLFGIAGLKVQSEDGDGGALPQDADGEDKDASRGDAGPDSDSGGSGGGGAGCFIATSVYGSAMSEEVRILSRFRDDFLLKSDIGKELVEVYYWLSPPVAEFIKDRPFFKAIIRTHLKILVALVNILTSYIGN